MYQQKLYAEATATITRRRQTARMQQEQHIDEVRRRIPEVMEIDRQLRSACVSLLQITKQTGAHAERLAALQKQSLEAQTLLRQVLRQHGYPEDYLDLHYTCMDCQDSGFRNGRPCICLQREIGRIGAERLNRHAQLQLCRFDTFSLSYYRNLPTEQYYTMEQIFHKCQSYAASFSSSSPSLLMTGKTGLGKTHLSLAIAGAVLERGYGVIYDAIGNLLRRLEQEQFGRAQETDADTMSLLLDCDLLILDDFGAEFDTSFSRSAIYSVLNGRLGASKPTIISTNLTHEQIQSRYGDRVVSRLFASCVGMAFCGTDVRLQKRMQQTSGNQTNEEDAR